MRRMRLHLDGIQKKGLVTCSASTVQKSAAVPVQDRSRQTIKQVVSVLDAAFEEVQ